MAGTIPIASFTNAPCGRCQKHLPAYDRVRALYTYDPPIDQLIHKLKYGRRMDLARIFGQRLAVHLTATANKSSVDLIIPIPLHRHRLRQRGYNQSLEIARSLSQRLHLPFIYKGVERIRATLPQTGLTLALRHKNMRDAFSVSLNLNGKAIAIVDDVMTSGATVDAFALQLRRAGAENIEVWVVARA